MAKYTIREAADIMGVSLDTVRRGVKSGRLAGEKVFERNVPIWYVEIEDADIPKVRQTTRDVTDEGLKARLDDLERDRDAWRNAALSLLQILEGQRT